MGTDTVWEDEAKTVLPPAKRRMESIAVVNFIILLSLL
jgi:hypothetical protein